MKFSYTWLQEYFDTPLPSVADVSRTITMHAFEIDGTEAHGDDTILDIKVLPNRSHDCFSYHGIAREIGALLDVSTNIPDVHPKTDAGVSTAEHLSLTIENSKLVPRALKRYVEGITIGESPDWLKAKLSAHGQRSINNVVDATNLTMLETGQPVHAFDFDKLAADKKLTIRSAREGETITTLDGKEFTLDSDALVISDSEKALDIAGVKGGSVSGVDANTTRLVLSACNFDPVNIRKTSKKLGLRTDASVRFEQGISPELAGIAMERLSALVEELAGGKVAHDIVESYPHKEALAVVSVSLPEINTALGTTCSQEEVAGYFARLGFGYEVKGDTFVVTVPAPRIDIRIKEDLMEEVGRLKGLEAIPSTQLPADGFLPAVNKNEYYKSLVRRALVDAGFSEVSTYAFQKTGDIEVANPIADDKKYLRGSLIDGVTAAMEMNKKNKPLLGTDMIRIFEIGTVFAKNSEHQELAVAAEKPAELDRGCAAVTQALGVDVSWKKNGGLAVASLTDAIKSLPTPDSYGDLPRLPNMTFVPISIYPFILRDIAVWIDDEADSQRPATGNSRALEDVIKSHAGILLARLDLFDTFKKDGRVSYAYHIVFQSSEKTLSDEEVGGIMKTIEDEIKGKGWEVR